MAGFFVFIGIILMVLSGGCTILVLAEGGGGDVLPAVLLIGGVPFVVGLFIFVMAKASQK